MTGNGLKGFGWFLCGVVVAPVCYMMTSQVAAERAKLEAVDAAIAKAHQDIRGLETEFNTRASMAQVERWNGEFLSLTAPEPGQYLGDPNQLASLDPLNGGEIQNAALLIPKGAPAATARAQAEAAPASSTPSEPARVAEVARRSGDATDRAPAGEEVAMLEKPLLSSSTMEDLQRRAGIERLALR